MPPELAALLVPHRERRALCLARDELLDIVRRAEVLDLAHAPGFEAAFVMALAFPAGGAVST